MIKLKHKHRGGLKMEKIIEKELKEITKLIRDRDNWRRTEFQSTSLDGENCVYDAYAYEYIPNPDYKIAYLYSKDDDKVEYISLFKKKSLIKRLPAVNLYGSIDAPTPWECEINSKYTYSFYLKNSAEYALYMFPHIENEEETRENIKFYTIFFEDEDELNRFNEFLGDHFDDFEAVATDEMYEKVIADSSIPEHKVRKEVVEFVLFRMFFDNWKNSSKN